MRILLIEDNAELAMTLVERFASHGHAIEHQSDGVAADSLLNYERFDIVLLDINLPGRDGYAILKALRQRGDQTPVMVLTARSQIDDRVDGLDSGADDYVVKPVDFRELEARCRALLRRHSGQASNHFHCGNFTFDRAARRASIDGIDLELRNRDVQLLETFLGRLDRIIAKDDLADKLYPHDEIPSMNAIEQSVTRLRRKLEGSPIRIRTIRGLGYMSCVRDD